MSELPVLTEEQLHILERVFLRKSVINRSPEARNDMVRRGVIGCRADYVGTGISYFVPTTYLMAVQAMVEG